MSKSNMLDDILNMRFGNTLLEFTDYMRGFNEGIETVVWRLDTEEKLAEIEVEPLVELPTHVASWIKDCKEKGKNLSFAIADKDIPMNVDSWLWDGSGDKSFTKFAKAWIHGYTVKEEPIKEELVRDKEVTLIILDDDYPNSNRVATINKSKVKGLMGFLGLKEDEK